MFTLEDGTGIVGANALVTVAEFDTYASDRNIDISAYSTPGIEGSIVIASSDFISVYYKFKGAPLNEDQGLSIPTNLVGITSKIKQATNDATLLQLQGKLFVSPNDINVSGGIKATSKSVGSLNTAVEYQAGNTYTTKYPTPTIDRLLSCYTLGGFAPGSSLRY